MPQHLSAPVLEQRAPLRPPAAVRGRTAHTSLLLLAQQIAGPQIDPELAFILLGALAAGVIAVIAGAMNSSATSAAERDTADTKALADKLEAAAREADAHLAKFLERERRRNGDENG